MMTRYRVNLNAVSLETISPAIMITDIAYSVPRYALVTSSRAARDGMHVQGKAAQNSTVTVSFEIHERNPQIRQDICRKVQAWAMHGGYLTTSDRPGQRLHVMCDTPPEISSALRWTEKLRIGFAAYENPYWEDVRETRATVHAGGSAKLYPRGTADKAYVSATVLNTGTSAINTLRLSVGDTFMAFENLALEAGKMLEIGYGEDGLLFIRADGVSRLDKRTAESSDDLVLPVGVSGDVSMTVTGAANAIFRVRGQYL